MPIETRYIADGTGFEMIGKGHITGKEICDALEEIYTSEKLPQQKFQIWHFTEVDNFDFPKHEFDRMVRLDANASQSNPNIIIAVVGEEDLIFGMSRMWEAHMQIEDAGFETMTFRQRAEADAWISMKLTTP